MSFRKTFFHDSELDRLESSLTELPPRCPPSGISILIVGAGPAGLFAALECWRKGHDVRVIERSSEPTTAGDHFSIAPQIARHINTRWPGLAQQNEAIADDPWLSIHRITGEVIKGPGPLSWKDEDDIGDYDPLLPTRFYRHHRAKFLRMLMVAVRGAGINITYGQRVVDYHEDAARQVAGVRLVDESGGGSVGATTMEADLVIAADGVGTKSHGAVNGHDIRAESSGYSLYRTCFPVERLAPYPELAHYMRPLDNGHSHVHVWAGLGVMGHATQGESWGAQVPVENVLQFVETMPDGGLPDLLKDLIRATPDDGIVDWKLMLRDPQPRVASESGRVVQVGDSAHTFLPSSGDGANQAMEDAISLASCLHVGGKSNIGWAVKIHNKLRFERVACAQIVGFLRFKQTMHPPDDKPSSLVSGPTSPSPSLTATTTTKPPIDLRSRLGRWQWAHDPEQYAYDQYGAVLRHLQMGTAFRNTNIPRGYEYRPWTFREVMDLVAQGKFLELGGDWS
ncbi:FAD/NAD(P)-binding domain-containing protein [Apiospora kogelbergensis]|uniref:FAD/NAD(P)-binding domain-containing protein n=1 Tax=Apiospora kogelbergensis TaxID=1337665 RepID=A0AAW0R7K0_9PEZI